MQYNTPSISDYYCKITEDVRGEILRESEEQIISSDIDSLALYYFDKNSISTVEVDEERDATLSQENYVKNIPARQREDIYQQKGDVDWECERVRVEIPIKPNDHIDLISSLYTNTFSLSYNPNEFNWNRDSVSFTIETKGYGFNYDVDKIAQEVNNGIARAKESIKWKTDDISKENDKLLGQIKTFIQERRNNIKTSKQKFSSLTSKISIPLKRKLSASVQNVNIDHRPIVKRVKPAPKLPEEYVLDESKVNDIIEIVDNQAKTFEKTPTSFKLLGEEDLRNLICANLNSIFVGSATAETFSKKGKTDIYLNIDKGNILIFECKFWGGKELYLETINQLRGYLTWRENYGIMITFVRNKNFTSVLKQIEDITKKSDSYIDGFKKISETCFHSRQRLDDEDKHIKLIHLFFNLYSE